MPPYEVHPYALDVLRDLLAAKAETNPETIGAKQHFTYFREYFDAIGARTIVVENDYTDRDYLEDFAGYYVRCFKEYSRRCTRLHFFDVPFDEPAFSSLLAAEKTSLTPDLLRKAYLGFIVVKPLPFTVVGRTCLRTYPSEDRRHFPITRTYEANLFGQPLTVESLAFQEQDTVAAACATSALWSALNGTGKQFQHHIPSPVEITRAATAHVPLDTRTFPNSAGLTLTQMSDAIRSVGLEPYLVEAGDTYTLKSTLYAYLRGHIPVLLGVELFDPQAPLDPVTHEPRAIGFHAITVTGYSLGKSPTVAYPGSGFLLNAFRMDKIYAHDDQVGPFARMEFGQGVCFGTSWNNDTGTGLLQALATVILIPLYEKIRIPFQAIFHVVSSFGSLIEGLQQHGYLSLPAPVEWHMYLTTVNDLKTELQGSASLRGDYRRRVLTHSMPRFIWRATASVGDTPALDLLFDATDIEQGTSFVGVIEYHAVLGQVLRAVSQHLAATPQVIARPDRHVLAWFSNPTF